MRRAPARKMASSLSLVPMNTGFRTNCPERDREMYSELLKTMVLSMVGVKDGVAMSAEAIEVELAARMHFSTAEESDCVEVPQPTALVTLSHLAPLVVAFSGGTT